MAHPQPLQKSSPLTKLHSSSFQSWQNQLLQSQTVRPLGVSTRQPMTCDTKSENGLYSSCDKFQRVRIGSLASIGRRHRKARVYFQPHQLKILEEFYNRKAYISSYDCELLAQQLGISQDRVLVQLFFIQLWCYIV